MMTTTTKTRRAPGALLGALLLALALAPAQAGADDLPSTTVNAFSGSLTSTVKIAVPPYRGLEPKLGLNYSSSGGNGLLGVGWSLGGVSYIERASPGRGTPRWDASDIHVLDGTQLLPCTTFGGTHCTRIESFQRITRDVPNNKWYVWGRDGTKTTYEPLLNVIAGTYRWAAKTVQDSLGNAVTYNYWCDGPDECYLDSVSYNQVTIQLHREARPDVVQYPLGGNLSTGATCYPTVVEDWCFAGSGVCGYSSEDSCMSFNGGDTCYLSSSTCYIGDFIVEDCSPQPCPKPGLATMRYRVKTISATVSGSLVRAYALTFVASTTTGRSILQSVQQYGRDATITNGVVTGGASLPALVLGVTAPATGFATWTWNSGGDWSGYETIPGDFNGDGRQDLYLHGRQGSGWGDYLCLSSGTSFSCALIAGGGAWNGFELIPGDFNGDGRTDIYLHGRYGTGLPDYMGLSTGTGFQQWTWAPGANWSSYAVAAGDFNGDGLADILLSWRGGGDGSAYLGLSTGAGFTTWNWSASYGTNAAFNSSSVLMLGDFNGDGKVDFANVCLSSLNLWLANGTGFDLVFFIYVGPFKRPYVGDFNGDGRADLLFVSYPLYSSPQGGWPMLFLSTGSSFVLIGSPASPYYLETTDDWQNYEVQVADFNGDGRADALLQGKSGTGLPTKMGLWNGAGFTMWNWAPGQNWSGYETTAADFDGDGRADFFMHGRSGTGGWGYLGLGASPGVVPDLVTTISNGLGGTTAVTYTPSTTWSNPGLPAGIVFPTVSAISINDGRGDTQQTMYTYQGAQWNAPDREFLGFRKATTTLSATGAYSETYYWQRVGTIAKPEAIYKRRYDGTIMSFEKFTFTENTQAPYTSMATEYWSYECNGQGTFTTDTPPVYQGGCRRMLATFAWDTYGNLYEERKYGDYDVSGDEYTAARGFVPNTSGYVVGLPAYENLHVGLGTAGTILSRTKFYYDGNASEITAPGAGRLTKKAVYDDSTGTWPAHTFAYDAYGNQTSITDPLGQTASKAYDATYHVYTVSTTDVIGTVQSGWDFTLGLATSTTDLNGSVASYGYDALGRTTLITTADGGQTKLEYLSVGDPNNCRTRLSVLQADGVSWEWEDNYFDGIGRGYKKVNLNGVTAVKVYAATGQPAQESAPYVSGDTVRYTTSTYDDLGRLTRVTAADGTAMSRSYGNGVQTVTDPAGKVRSAYFDAYGRQTLVREWVGGQAKDTAFFYDLLGRRTKAVDAAGIQTVAVYDSLGRTLQKSDPDQGVWQYGYDAMGRLTSETDAASQTTRLYYDAVGRVTKRLYHDATYDLYTFDETGRGASKGRVTTAVSASGVTTRSWYDVMGRHTKVEQVIDATTYATSHSYDRLGRVATVTYPDGEVVSYGYGTSGLALGKLVSVSGSQAGSVVTNVTYTSRGQAATLVYANGVTTTYGYDAYGEKLAQIGVGSLLSLNYAYTPQGLVQAVTSTSSTNWTYGYDDLGRLTLATNNANSAYTQRFCYDAVGRMTCNTKKGVYSYGDAAHPHAVTVAGADTYAYDANGNLTSGGGRSFTYTLDHRVASVTRSGVTTSFVYDAGGQRVKKSGASGSVVYQGSLYENRGGVVTKYYLAGMARVAKRVGTTNTFLHGDHQGSTRLVTNASGQEVKYYDYAPYGRVIAESGTGSDSHRYTGQEMDDETGLHFYRARYYDSDLGRFIQPDPFLPSANTPQELDPYAYVSNSPVSAVDPTGHAAALVAIGTFLGFTGTAALIAGAVFCVVIGTALTFTNNSFLQTIGMIMSGVGSVGLGPLAGSNWAYYAAGAVALAQSPISPLDPTIKKAIGWAWTAYCSFKTVEAVKDGGGLLPTFKEAGTGTIKAAWNSIAGAVNSFVDGFARGSWPGSTVAVAAKEAAGIVLTLVATAGASHLPTGGKWAFAFIARAFINGSGTSQGPLAFVGSSFDLYYSLKYPDGRVYDLSGGAGGESFTLYYHTGFEQPFAFGRQHIRVGDPKGGYWEIGDASGGWFGPGLGWGGWITTQKVTVILSTAQAAAFRGALQKGADAGGTYWGYHTDSYTYVSAALEYATSKSVADLHINPGLLHW